MAMVTVTTMAMAMSDGDDGDDRLKEQIHPNDIIIIIIIFAPPECVGSLGRRLC